jgi:hypothetical protein
MTKTRLPTTMGEEFDQFGRRVRQRMLLDCVASRDQRMTDRILFALAGWGSFTSFHVLPSENACGGVAPG